MSQESTGPLKVAVLGAGAICDSHLEAYLRFPGRCQIVAIADLFPDKARQKAARHGLEIPVFRNVDELLKGSNPDAVSVCLPPFEHAPVTLALLRAGIHVLVEKPMATCLADCDAMIFAARSQGRLLSVVAQNRFKTPMIKLKRLLESGLLGRVLHAQVDSFWWRGAHYYDLWWRGTWAKEGGGCLLNHSVHHLDLFQWMRGLPTEILAATTNLNHDNSEVEDFATALLTHADGTLSQVTASLVHHGEDQQLVFQTERARVTVPWQVRAMRQRENGFPEDDEAARIQIQRFYDSLPALTYEGHDGQIENFLSAIEGREALVIDGEQGRRTLELITAIYQSSHLDQKTRLPLTPDAPFYKADGILRLARRFREKTRSVENLVDHGITLGRDFGK